MMFETPEECFKKVEHNIIPKSDSILSSSEIENELIHRRTSLIKKIDLMTNYLIIIAKELETEKKKRSKKCLIM